MRFDLLKTILWLRWRLTRNQARKVGRFVQVFTMILTALAGVAILGALIGGYVAGRYLPATVPPRTLMLVFDAVVGGFLFIWVLGVLSEIQRSEAIDLQRLLHLPVTLRDVFVVNFLASHLTFSVLLVLPLISGMALGLAVARDALWLTALPLFLSFVFFVSAWTYCLRGWLVQLMVNPRRRRTIVIMLTMLVVLGAQLPNLFINVFGRQMARSPGNPGSSVPFRLEQFQGIVEHAHDDLPPLWVGWGARGAAEGNGWPAAGAFVLCLAGGAAGLSRAYRSTLRFYRGEGAGTRLKAVKTDPAPAVVPSRPLEGRLPFVPDEVSAATLAFWRSMVRAPELKMALLGPLLMIGVLAMAIFRGPPAEGFQRAIPLIAIGITIFSLTGVLQIAFNQFGWDRTGFRALVLLPTPRARLLLAKNLAAGGIMLGMGLFVYVLIALYLRVPLIDHAAGWLQVLTVILMLCALGNYLSIMLPVRMNVGSLKPTKMPVKVVLLMMLCTLALPLYLLPVMLGPGLGLLAGFLGSDLGSWLNLAASLLTLAVIAGLYALTLKPLSRLLWEREQRILEIVTAEVE